ncbi:hypothetical protein AB0L04_10290 [Streptomyces glaucescens]|uniref:cytidylyltransferase domain-containing protein n=1 Tax=Streptomyces glaucescens TaxID=1907 RepID=UPI00344F904D
MAATTVAPPSTGPRHHIAAIPCRWESSRFPGKPLAQLGGKCAVRSAGLGARRSTPAVG